MSFVQDYLEKRRAQREVEATVYKEIGQSVAAFGDYQAHLYLKDRFIEEGELFDKLRSKLKQFADQRMDQFLHDDKQGKHIALNIHYAPPEVSNHDLVNTVNEIRVLLAAYAPEKFGQPAQQAKFIDGFDSRVGGVIQQVQWKVDHLKPMPASAMGM